MKSSKSGNYQNFQHCWARFTCPKDRHAEYKIASDFGFESGYDYLTFYAKNTNQLTTIESNFDNKAQWLSLADSTISIEFRSDYSNVDVGFDMELRCMLN